MRLRLSIHDDFVKRFHVGKPRSPVTTQQLDAIETELRTKLPNAFREFLTRHGTVYTPNILRKIVDDDIGHPDIQAFLDSKEAILETKAYWAAGMPEDVIGVAYDCMGNMIGFRRQINPSEDAPVIFFDHDFLVVTQIARGFDDLLAWFLDHLKD